MTAPSLSRQSSCISTVSAPSGMAAPVKMRIASPRSGHAAERMAGGSAARHRQRRRPLGREIGEAHGIAIDRGVVVRRHIAGRDERRREDASGRVLERDGLDLGQGQGQGPDAVERFRARHQAAAEGEAIIAELRHRRASSRHCARMKDGDRRDVVERQARHTQAGHGLVGRDRHDLGIVRAEERPAECQAVEFEFRKGVALEPLDDHQIDRRHVRRGACRERGLARAAMLVHQRPAGPRRRSGTSLAPAWRCFQLSLPGWSRSKW